jgi:phosphoserine aminotransferase
MLAQSPHCQPACGPFAKAGDFIHANHDDISFMPVTVRHNFSAGPGALPDCVLQETRTAIGAVPEVGLPLLGISHRSRWFQRVVEEAEEHFRALLNLPSDYHVLFLQGGSTL